MSQFPGESVAPGFELGQFQLILAQGLFQRGDFALGMRQCPEGNGLLIAQCLTLLALMGEPGSTLTDIHSSQFGIERMCRQGLLGLRQALLSVLLLLAAAGDGCLLSAIFAFQLIMHLLCLIPGLPGRGQLRILFRLLGGKLRRFWRNRRLLAEGVVKSATHRTGRIFLQGFAQVNHALAPDGAATLDKVA